MFEKDLERRLRSIFGVSKTTYNAPNYDALEQDCLFVQIAEVKSRMSNNDGGRQIYHAVGFLTIFSQNQRIPFGFFMKKLEQGDPDDVKPLIFEKEMDIVDSSARMQNLQERRISFTFLYDSQYDPDRGSLTVLETNFLE